MRSVMKPRIVMIGTSGAIAILSGIEARETFPEIPMMTGVQKMVAERGIARTSAKTRGRPNFNWKY